MTLTVIPAMAVLHSRSSNYSRYPLYGLRSQGRLDRITQVTHTTAIKPVVGKLILIVVLAITTIDPTY